MEDEPRTKENGDAYYDRYEAADGEFVTERVVRCVAVVTDTAPSELPPIYDVLDPEALDALFPPRGDGNCRVHFSFAETEVTISEVGDVRVGLEGDLD